MKNALIGSTLALACLVMFPASVLAVQGPAVPELDPGAFHSVLALLIGGAAAVVASRRQPKLDP